MASGRRLSEIETAYLIEHSDHDHFLSASFGPGVVILSAGPESDWARELLDIRTAALAMDP